MFRFRPARLLGLAALAFAVAALMSAAPTARVAAQEKKDQKKVKSKLKVKVPQDDAILLIENKETKPTGEVREFETPEIESGKLYEYAFTVKWEPNNYTKLTRTKTVEFKGGDEITVDLTKEDPKKVTEAKENVKKAGLSDKITIIEVDALKDRDYSEATIVFLYMGNEFDLLLRPVLEKQLKPGTRIVSHRFTMGDWKPDKTIKVMGEDGDEYTLHLWVVGEKKK